MPLLSAPSFSREGVDKTETVRRAHSGGVTFKKISQRKVKRRYSGARR
jgi:hypothetical protein